MHMNNNMSKKYMRLQAMMCAGIRVENVTGRKMGRHKRHTNTNTK